MFITLGTSADVRAWEEASRKESIKQPSSQSLALRGNNDGWHCRNLKEKGSNVEQEVLYETGFFRPSNKRPLGVAGS
jgi:hypothetical protein